ncbi:MAG: metallophosphoesterase [Candidatus Margulisbacteria bacterium]|nr:metallophosphoesterase [Candidatus Margulisiibacteriota bacterium]
MNPYSPAAFLYANDSNLVQGKPDEASGRLYRFAVFGDSQSGYSGTAVSSKLAIIVASIEALSPLPDFLVCVGDAVEEGGIDGLRIWVESLKPLTDKKIPVYLAKGNHEVFPYDNARQLQKEYQDCFNFPKNGPEGYEDLCYYFGSNDSIFVCYDSYYFNNMNDKQTMGITSDQLSWLESVLSADRKFKFVFTHVPEISEELQNVLNEKDVAVIFTGHIHVLHSRMLGSTRLIITGGATGTDHYDYPDTYECNHYLVVDVYDSSVVINAYRLDGTLLESYNVIR